MILSGADNRPPMLDKNLTKKYAELSAAEKIQADCDMKAANIILQGLPVDIYSLMNHHRVAKDLSKRVQLLMQGESLHTYYLRFTQMVNDMNIYKINMEQFQVNTKFLNSLPPEWSNFVTDVKLVKDLHTSNYDQLHAYLEQHKLHAKEVRLIRDDSIAYLNKAMVFLTAVASSRVPNSDNYDNYLNDMDNQNIQRSESCDKCLNLAAELSKSKQAYNDLLNKTKKYAELSAAEKIQADCDMKAANIILQGLPVDIYSLMNHHRVAKDLSKRVQLLMQGESLHTYYLRFTQMVNDMNIYKINMEQFQVNTKFLNSLPPEWSNFVTDVKLVKDLHTSNYDQLHAYLEQHKLHAKEVRLIRDDSIAYLNKAMVFLTAVASSRVPNSDNYDNYLNDMDNQNIQRSESCDKCLNLAAELSKSKQAYNDLLNNSKANSVYVFVNNAPVKNSMNDVKSGCLCAICGKCMIAETHHECVQLVVTKMDESKKSKSAKKQKKQNAWKPTGHVFTKVGLKWKPTGRTFTIVGNCSQLMNFVSKFLGTVRFRNDQITRIISKTLYELMQHKKPDLSFLHIFGSLCYPINDHEDLGKFDAKADIMIFVGYAPAKKAFRIYNKRTQIISETNHVTFYELTKMASEQFSLGPDLNVMTPATPSTGLVSNPVSQQPCISPNRDDWDRLFQSMFDEYNIFPPLDNPEIKIQRRSRADSTLLNDFEMAVEGTGDLPVPDLRTMEELCQPSLNGRDGPIASIIIQAMKFGLKNDMIKQVQNSFQFYGLSGDD
nr:hypothetical protein [Tanacetum cinerariifolium]